MHGSKKVSVAICLMLNLRLTGLLVHKLKLSIYHVLEVRWGYVIMFSEFCFIRKTPLLMSTQLNV